MPKTGISGLPLVTIGIPTYNRLDGYFPRALQAALGQTYPNLEIVVSDNASTDGTEAYMRRLDDPRIKYVRHPRNIGARANFNACLDNASGEYFLLFHDDDVIDAAFVSSCVKALCGNTDIGLVRTGAKVIDGSNRELAVQSLSQPPMSPGDVIGDWFDRKTPLYLASTLYNTAHLRSVGGFESPHGLYQDVKATVQLMVRYGHVEVSEPLASFRRHEANRGSARSAVEWAEDALHLLSVIAEELPDLPKERMEAGKRYLCQKCYRIASANPSTKERWAAYRQIDHLFGGVLTPVVYEAVRLRRGVTGVVRKLLPSRRVLLGNQDALA